MIIKEDRVLLSDPDQHAENPPPYSVSADGVQFTNVSTLSSPTRSTAGAGLAVVTRSSSEPGPAEIRRIPPSPTDSSSASGTFVDAPNALPVPPKSSKGYPPNPIASSSSALADNRYFNENSNSSSSALPMDTPPSPIPAPADAPPTSFVHMRKFNRSVTGKFVLDPRFPRPPGTRMGLEKARSDPIDDDVCLPAWEDDGPGGPGASVDPNMLLECKNGNIDADVWILGAKAGEGEENVKARLDVLDKNGFVFVKVHTTEDSSPFALRIHVKNGGVRLGISRAFQGPLTTRMRNGWMNTSRPLAQASAVFSEVNGTRKTFVGSYLGSNYGDGGWTGSSIDIICENGRVKLFYIDELESKQQRRNSESKSWLGKLFSL